MRTTMRVYSTLISRVEGINLQCASVLQVGTISANGDTEIGQLIATAMEKVGKEGVITVADGKTLENELEVVEGMKFDRGYISPYFVTDNKTMRTEYENPMVLVYDKKISSLQQFMPLLEKAAQSQRPLLVIAEDIEGEPLATLILNRLRAGLKVVAVKAPGFGENRKANLRDIAVLTGAEVVSEEVGMKLENVDVETLGSARKVRTLQTQVCAHITSMWCCTHWHVSAPAAVKREWWQASSNLCAQSCRRMRYAKWHVCADHGHKR